MTRVLERPADKRAREALENAIAHDRLIFEALESHGDFIRHRQARGRLVSGTPAKRHSHDVTSRTIFMRYLFAPAPRKLLLWEDAGTDVDRPLARLGEPEGCLGLSIAAVLGGQENNGLRKGEGLLVRLFAAEFEFDRRHWPHWIQEVSRR